MNGVVVTEARMEVPVSLHDQLVAKLGAPTPVPHAHPRSATNRSG